MAVEEQETVTASRPAAVITRNSGIMRFLSTPLPQAALQMVMTITVTVAR
jgi:hypothetical protein